MKKFLMTIAMAICVAGASFAQSSNIDAGVVMNYSAGYDGIAFGGTVDFDYVLPANIAIFSNTNFAFGSGSPKFVIAEILGAGYRFNLSEKLYLQAGAGVGVVFIDYNYVEFSRVHEIIYGMFGPALAVKFGIKFTETIGMNFGLDAIYHPIKVWQDGPHSHVRRSFLSVIPKVCFVWSF